MLDGSVHIEWQRVGKCVNKEARNEAAHAHLRDVRRCKKSARTNDWVGSLPLANNSMHYWL